ncbi:hypothetical protein Cgig2_004480 [Carnegiea gigantea]|uniref:Uncharacterized protein n=1 Tax=Carnegiea gigantea TaxID=171969 RepID=A0A9Q1GGB2_9CARY|nr:hypothetical protein Cgig2_004480 [Carnegiea gigantea]
MNLNPDLNDTIPRRGWLSKINLRNMSGHISDALLETYISGGRAEMVCGHSGYDRWHRRDIWILWNFQDIDIGIILSHEQFIIMRAWMRSELDRYNCLCYFAPTRNRGLLGGCSVVWSYCATSLAFSGDFNETVSLKKGIMVELKCSGTVKNLNMGLAIMISLIWAFLATNSPR